MSLPELLLLAVGLAMDAFAVSLCKGLSAGRPSLPAMLSVGLWFGGFQAFMPALGYLLGSAVGQVISSFDHWVAFLLLSFIGGHMLKESRDKTPPADPSFGVRAMLPLALATSIDALAVGVTFALLPRVNLAAALAAIGGVTALLSAAGLALGGVVGERFQARAKVAGGVILIAIGLKILLQDLGLLPF